MSRVTVHLALGTEFLASSRTGAWPPVPSGPVVGSVSSFSAWEAPTRSQNHTGTVGGLLAARFCCTCQLTVLPGCPRGNDHQLQTRHPISRKPLATGSASNPSLRRLLKAPQNLGQTFCLGFSSFTLLDALLCDSLQLTHLLYRNPSAKLIRQEGTTRGSPSPRSTATSCARGH